MPTLEEFGEETVEQHHLTGKIDDFLKVGFYALFTVIKLRKRVIRYLTEVGDQATELGLLVLNIDCGDTTELADLRQWRGQERKQELNLPVGLADNLASSSFSFS